MCRSLASKASLLFLQAVLLVGYAQYEVDQFRAFMIDMDADMVKVRSE